MAEKILFLTGHLARPRLEAVLGGMEAGFDWSVTFGPSLAGPVPLAVEIFAGFSIFADLEVGIDTFGLQTTGNFLDGFFFDDTTPVFGVGAEFGASAEITLALIWAGLTGGVGA